jgi:hypothetical protein
MSQVRYADKQLEGLALSPSFGDDPDVEAMRAALVERAAHFLQLDEFSPAAAAAGERVAHELGEMLRAAPARPTR